MEDIVSQAILDSIDHKPLWKAKSTDLAKEWLDPLKCVTFSICNDSPSNPLAIDPDHFFGIFLEQS